MTVGKKLTICIAGMLAAVLSLAGAAWYATQSLGSELNFATTTVGMRTMSAGALQGEVIGMREKQRGVLMYSLAHDAKRAESNRGEFHEFLKEAKASIAAIRPLVTSPEGRAAIATVDADVDQYAASFEEASSLAANGKSMAALAFYRDKGGVVGGHMEKAAADYLALQKAALADASASGIQKTSAIRWIAGVFVAIALAVVGVVSFIVRKVVSQLRTIASSLSDGASQIAAGSGQVSSSSQTLAQGASEQASSLEETSASAEEITSMTRQNASNTSQVADLMNTVDHRVSEGNSTLAAMVASMKQINDSSGKISKIIKVIDEIAFQTNILALNAAVEAARAGEAGMGFAVVADEVRNLAQRSAQAAKDTASLIEESITTSNEGSTQLQKVAEVVGSITEAANKVKVLVDEVNIGSQDQAKGIEEIARSLSEMDKVTQGTAAAAEESASASEQMSAQAQALSHIVDELRTMAG
jgi:methyl-accepting chemotaxis protein/methyl-accepting chemotaxis protein-1 (serine sensor receptor)